MYYYPVFHWVDELYKSFFVRRRGFDEIDAVEKHSLEIGQEWPDGEDPGVARYRLFYQVYNKSSNLLHHLLFC